MSTELRETSTITVGSDGVATIRMGPKKAWETWTVRRVSISVTSNTTEPQFSLYRGEPSNTTFIVGSYTGSKDDDPEVNYILRPGDYFTGVWTSAVVGATAILSVYGERN